MALTRDVAAGFAVTPFARSDVAVDDARRRRLGEGRDRQRRRQPQGPPPRDDPAPPAGGRGARGWPSGRGRPLAIASCGNAAIAAATLAAAGRVADRGVRARLGRRRPCSTCSRRSGASITTCPRRADDPPGDPAVLRFREAVAAGAVPFSVQGPENALCLDGGRTIGWELADAGVDLDRVVVQVGGGAFAACVGLGARRRRAPRRRAGRGLRAAGAGVASGAGGAAGRRGRRAAGPS